MPLDGAGEREARNLSNKLCTTGVRPLPSFSPSDQKYLKFIFCMDRFWFIWLLAGLSLSSVVAGLGALEAMLWKTPRKQTAQWPRSSRRPSEAANLVHPRDCLLSFLMFFGGLLQAGSWWLLWVAGMAASRVLPGPGWAWVLLFLGSVILLGVVPELIAVRRPRVWGSLFLWVGGTILGIFGPFFDRFQPLAARAAENVFPWSLRRRSPRRLEEAETLIWMREEEGKFTMAEAEVLAQTLKLSLANVRNYMTPRVDVIFVEDSMSNEQVRSLLQKKRFVRTPVIGETPDEVLGLLDARVMSRMPPGMHFTEALLPPSFIPETMEASELLRGFLKHRQPLAVVLDEFGGVEGVVTLDDFLDEILSGAAPRVESDLYIEELGDGRLLASGAARLADLSEYLGFEATREGIETIGGHIIQELGKLPRYGTSVRLGPWKVTVRAVSQRRVREVSLQRVHTKNEWEVWK